MYSKPLTYDSVRSVFLRMDPILRFTLSSRLPSLRCCERNVPIFMESLSPNFNYLQVNSIKFVLKCVQKNSIILTEDQKMLMHPENSRGVDFDLNKYGMCDWSVDDVLTPGDIVYPSIYDDEWEESRNQHWEMIEVLDGILEAEGNLEVLPETYLVFVILYEDVPIHTEYLDYGRNMAQAMKYMTSKLLGGRTIYMQEFWIQDGGVLRLPEHLSLRISSYWDTEHDFARVYNSLEKIVDPLSFPVKYLQIRNGDTFHQTENYQHPIVRSAKYIEVNCTSKEVFWLETILKITNLWVHWECGVPKEDIRKAVDTWLKEGREIGSDVSFGISDPEDIKILMEDFKTRKNCDATRFSGIKYVY